MQIYLIKLPNRNNFIDILNGDFSPRSSSATIKKGFDGEYKFIEADEFKKKYPAGKSAGYSK